MPVARRHVPREVLAHAGEPLGEARGVHGAVVVDEVAGSLMGGEQLGAARRSLEEGGFGEHLRPPRATGEHARTRQAAARGRAGPRIDEVVTPCRRRAPHATGAPCGSDGAGTQAHEHHRPAGERVLEVDDPTVAVGCLALDAEVAAEVHAHAVDVTRHQLRRPRGRRRSPCRCHRDRSARRAASARRRRRGRR